MPRRAVVVGGGPAGILTSIYLAQLGYDEVVVYERREEPSEKQRNSQHSYPMVLTSRATMAFAEAGVSPACTSEAAGSLPCGGHFLNGALRGGGPMPPELVTWLVDRVGLAADLLAEARRVWPERIRFVFSALLSDLDLAARRAVFRLASGAEAVEEGYELLVGADGAKSAVRGYVQAQVPGFRSRLLYSSPVEYKTFHGLPRSYPAPGGEGGGAAGAELVPGLAAHQPRQHVYWFDNGRGPLLALWLTEGGQLDGLVSKVDSWDAAALSARLSACHPALPAALVGAVVAQVGVGAGAGDGPAAAAPPPSRFGSIVSCDRFHGPRCVLVGDAAHAVTGHLGQGANMALESVRMLAGCLRRTGGDPEAALPLFSEQRLRDAHAMQHIELCMNAFKTPASASKAAAAASAAPAASDGAAAAPAAPLSLAFRAYAAALLTSSMLCGALLHRLAPRTHPLPLRLLADLRDGRRGYAAALRNCRAMMAGAALAAAAGAAALAAVALRRYGRGAP